MFTYITLPRLARFASSTPVEVTTEKPKVVSLNPAKRPSTEVPETSPAKITKVVMGNSDSNTEETEVGELLS